MTFLLRRPAGLLAAIPLAAALTARADGLTVRLAEEASVTGPRITLGEVAEVTGDQTARVQRARRVDLGRAAPAKRERTVPARLVRMALLKAGFGEGEFEVIGAAEVRVRTASQVLAVRELLPALREFILLKSGENPADVVVEPGPGFDREVLLPEGKRTVEFRPPVHGRYEGALLFTAEVSVDGRRVKTLPLRVDVRLERPAVATTARVERGETFTEENVEAVRVPSSRLPSGALGSLSEALGRRADKALAPGSVLRYADLHDPPAVRRGQTVRGIFRKGSVELSVEVEVLRDGKVGDTVPVQNARSGARLRGRVLDEKTVRILPN